MVDSIKERCNEENLVSLMFLENILKRVNAKYGNFENITR